MKIVSYKCDRCGKLRDRKPKWLEIGSASEYQLYAINELSDARTEKLSNHSAIHFCSKECLIDFFFINDKN